MAPSTLVLRPDLKALRLNLGCGVRYRPDWTNVDLFSDDPAVLRVDLRQRFPLADNRFAAVYHSHVLEHLERAVGQAMLNECFRVLAPGGILRVVVPDLETLSRWYLDALGQATTDSGKLTDVRHRWAASGITDQCSRDTSGGELLKLWASTPEIKADAWLASKAGVQALTCDAPSDSAPANKHHRSLATRLRNSLLRRLLGRYDYHALRIGRFRLSGETHKFMYDRVSLSAAMLEAGFVQITAHTAVSSRITGFDPHGLDTEADGSIYKPESLFFEGTKPERA